MDKNFSSDSWTRLRRINNGLWVFLCSTLLFATFLTFMPDSVREKPCSDCSGWYFPVAENLASGRGLVVGDQNRPALDRPPGQVLLLSGLFRILPDTLLDRDVVVYAYNAFLLGISCVLLFSISRLYWGLRGGVITAVAWVTSPFVLWFLTQPYSEVPFFVAMFFASWIILKSESARPLRQELVLVGIALGVATLIRPIGFALIVPFLMFFWIKNRQLTWRIRSAGSMFLLLGYLATLMPWQVYLYDQKSEIVFLSYGVHGSRSVLEGFIFGIRSEEYKEEIELHPSVKDFMEDMHILFNGPKNDFNTLGIDAPIGRSSPPSTRELLKIAHERFIEDPVLAWRFFSLKILRSWYGTDSHRNEDAARLLMAVYVLLAGLGLWGTIRNKCTRGLGIFVILITLYFWAFAIVFTPLVRYMIPALGMLFIILPGIRTIVGKRDIGNTSRSY